MSLDAVEYISLSSLYEDKTSQDIQENNTREVVHTDYYAFAAARLLLALFELSLPRPTGTSKLKYLPPLRGYGRRLGLQRFP